MTAPPDPPGALLSASSVAELLASAGVSAVSTQERELGEVGERAGRAIAAGSAVYAFGAGHAQAFAMELCSRAGGLPGFLSMSLEDLRPERRDFCWSLRDSEPERSARAGIDLLAHHGVGPGDVVLIASQSGRNGAAVEMARQCRRQSVYVVGVTCLAHSANVPSRHRLGYKLADVVDIVLDNKGVLGDAMVHLPGGQRIAAASTVSFALLAQAIVVETVRFLLSEGIMPRVNLSANVDVPTAGPGAVSRRDG